MLPEPVRAALAGATAPVCAYVYDTATLRATAAALRAALPDGTTLLYAVKANGHPAVAAALAEVCDGLEVASGGELELAVAAGARTIAFGGPAKTDAELRSALAAGALVHAESPLELRRLAALATGPLDIALRVNRAGGTLGGTHRMAGAPTPFGIEEAQLPAAAALAADLPHLRVVGFHLHAVSNNLDADAHTAFVDEAVRWSVATAARLGIKLSYVNVGGGLGVDYLTGEALPLPRLRPQPPPSGVRLAFEPGRYLTAAAGWYAAEVLDLKHNHGRWFAVLRGGTHHFRLPAAWGYSHPFTVLPREQWPYDFARPEVRDVEVDAAGELCTPRDILTRGQRVTRLRVGDVLVFGHAGAYGWDISHHDYLKHPRPQMFVV
ncbi:alanine racemase [Phytohabitans kaempferiae]|uniref:Alanine racemase n=1 Tax=Phytohabitans kaempferiae TaxID=1620943 RepID=A0ABV6MFV5_9ACTN